MKIPFQFGFSFLLRVILPGIFWSVFSYPLIYPIFNEIFKSTDLEFLIDPKFFISFEIIIVGIIINMLDDKIYQIAEGRILWFNFLKKKGIKSEKKYIKRHVNLINELRKRNEINSHRYLEAWYKLRIFPLDEKSEYKADYPTRLGNIIQGYEKYSKSRFGIDSIFWWYRIWLTLDKEIRGEIDRSLSKADFAVYSSFIFYILFIANLIGYGISYLIGNIFISIYTSRSSFLLIALLPIILSRLFYKLSLPLHRFYGEYFKSMFDLHKDKIINLDRLFKKKEKKKIEEVTRYLQYHKIKCFNCGSLNPGDSDNCTSCGARLYRDE